MPVNLLTLPFRALIALYRYLISPFFPGSCRYHPSCSAYADEALSVHGVMRGSFLTIRRILRCQPWGGSGYDPVPLPKADLTDGQKGSLESS